MDELDALRREIDAVDRQLVEWLAQRFGIAGRIAAVKSANGIPERIAEVVVSREQWGLDLGLPQEAAGKIWSLIVEETCRAEEEMLAGGPANENA